MNPLYVPEGLASPQDASRADSTLVRPAPWTAGDPGASGDALVVRIGVLSISLGPGIAVEWGPATDELDELDRALERAVGVSEIAELLASESEAIYSKEDGTPL